MGHRNHVFDAPAISAVIDNEVAGFDGSIDITVTGGFGNYDYSWSNGQTNQDAIGLTAGDYTVTVNDGVCSTDSTFTVISVMGMNENDSFSFELFPNPNNGNFTVVFPTELNNGSIEIMDASGKLVYSEQLVSNQVVLDVNFLQDGVYFIRYIGETNSYSSQFVKQ